MSEQRRNFTRISFDADTSVNQGQHHYPVELLDISLNGVLFKQPLEWQINPRKPVIISIELSSDCIIRMEARIEHLSEDTAGCQCLNIDLDSISQLKRLVELNVGANALLDRELAALVQQD